MISGVHRDVNEVRTVLGFYAASDCNCIQMLRDNLSVPSSEVKQSKNCQELPITA